MKESKPGDGGNGGVPAGYVAAPITVSRLATVAGMAPVRVCALARRTADPVAGRFVTVRQTAVGRAVLGCLTDSAGTVLDWLEAWVQLPAVDGPPPWLEPTNAAADVRWDRLVDGFARQGRTGGYLSSGWERGLVVRSLVLRPDLTAIGPLVDADTGDAWSLCMDEDVLQAAGLPGYATSPHRYLYLPGKNGRPLVPVTAGAPMSARTIPLAEAWDGDASLAFNLTAGRMFLRRHGPVPLEGLLDVLAGRPWNGVSHGAAVVPVGGGVESLRTAAAREGTTLPDDGRVFLGRHGRWGRIVESFHLRLRLISDMVAAVRQAVATGGRPLLSLGPDSFQICLPDVASGLPFLWSAEVLLASPGEAVTAQVPGSDLTYFPAPGGGTASIYRPGVGPGSSASGDGMVRVRRVVPDAAQGVVVEGTLATAERIDRVPGQLLWLRPVLGSGPVELYARLDDGPPPAPGEWRFRTVGQRLSPQVATELQAAAGVPLARVPFAVFTTAQVTADLYALAVLAVRALLTGSDETPLAVAVDEMLSLARYLAEHHDPDTSPGLRVQAAAHSDPRWLTALGPQHLVAEELTPQAALALVPSDLWWDTIAAVVRMFPGVGPDSTSPPGDAAATTLAPARVFDPTLAEFDALIRRTRSLIVVDWQYNREVAAAIRTRLAQVEAADNGYAAGTVAGIRR